MNPKRIQRTRKHRLPENTVCVTRPGKWGNPFVVGEQYTQAEAVLAFEAALESGQLPITPAEVRRDLSGKNLACWCKLGTPCHAQILLAIATDDRGVDEIDRQLDGFISELRAVELERKATDS